MVLSKKNPTFAGKTEHNGCIMSEEITIQSIASDENVSVEYSDDDIVIIDNVRKLVDPPPTRMNMHLLVICIQGRAEGSLGAMPLELHKNQVAICPPNMALTRFMISPDFEFKAMFFTTRILQSFLREKMSLWNEVVYIHHLHVVTMDEPDIAYYSHFYEMLRMCIDADKHTPYRTEVIQSLLRSAFLALCGRILQLSPQPVSQAGTVNAGGTLFQRFLHLLENAKVKHRPVEAYASELCVSPKYLSAMCKKASGKTANQWITEHVMEDIRYELCHTEHTIKQICDLLGFPNASFFGKYVRQHFGVTPVQLRQS